MTRLKLLTFFCLSPAITASLLSAAPPRFSEQFQGTQTQYTTGGSDSTHYLTHFTNRTPRAGLVWNQKFYFASSASFDFRGSDSPSGFASGIASWDGYSWYPLFDSESCGSGQNEGVYFQPSQSESDVHQVMALDTYNGFTKEGSSEWLIVAGRISRAGHYGRCANNLDTVRNIAAWQPDMTGTGGTWKVFGGPDLSDVNGAGPGGYDDEVGVRCMFIGTVGGQQRIYIFGDFNKVEQPPGGGSPLNGLNGIAYFDGTSWNAVDFGPMVSGSTPRRIHTVVPVKLRAYPTEITLIVGGWFDQLDDGTTLAACNSAAIMRIDPTSGAVTWEKFDDGVRINTDPVSAGSVLAVAQRPPTEGDPYPPIYVGGRIDEVGATGSLAVQVANIARVTQPSTGGRVWQRIDGTTADESNDSLYLRSGVANRGPEEIPPCYRFVINRSNATVSALAFGPADPADAGSNSKLYIGGHFTFAGTREKHAGDEVEGLVIDQGNDCNLGADDTSAMFVLNVCAFDEDEKQEHRISRTDIGLHANHPSSDMNLFYAPTDGWQQIGHGNTGSCLTSFVSNWNENTAHGPDQSCDALGVFAIGAFSCLSHPRASREDSLVAGEWCFPTDPINAPFRDTYVEGLSYWDCNQVQGRESGLTRVFASEWKEINQGFSGVVTSLRTESFEAYTTGGSQVARERLVIASEASNTVLAQQVMLFDGETLRRVDWPGHVELQSDELPSPANATAPLRPGAVSGLNDAFPIRITATNAQSYTTTFMTSNSLPTGTGACFVNSLTGGYINSVSMTSVETRLDPSTPPPYSEVYAPQYWQQWGSGNRLNTQAFSSTVSFSGTIGDSGSPHRVRAFGRDEPGYVLDVYMLEKLQYVDSMSVRRARGLLRLKITDTSSGDGVIGDFSDPGNPSIRLPWESGFDDIVIDTTSDGAGAVWDMIPWPEMEGIFVIGGRFAYTVTVGKDTWTCVNIALYKPASGIVYPIGGTHLTGDPEDNIYGVNGTVKVLARVRDPFDLSESYKIAVGGEFQTDRTIDTGRLRCIGFVNPTKNETLGAIPCAKVDPVVDRCGYAYGVEITSQEAASVNAIASFQHQTQFLDSTPAMWIGGHFDTFKAVTSSTVFVSATAHHLAFVDYSGFRAPTLGIAQRNTADAFPARVNAMSVLTDQHHTTPEENTRLYVGGEFGNTLTVFAGFTSASVATTRSTDNLAAIIPGLACLANYNNDDAVDLFDYLDFVADFSVLYCRADFNSDGVVDFFDYLDFVAEFAAGCGVEL